MVCFMMADNTIVTTDMMIGIYAAIPVVGAAFLPNAACALARFVWYCMTKNNATKHKNTMINIIAFTLLCADVSSASSQIAFSHRTPYGSSLALLILNTC